MQNWEPPFEAGGQCVLLAGNSLKGPHQSVEYCLWSTSASEIATCVTHFTQTRNRETVLGFGFRRVAESVAWKFEFLSKNKKMLANSYFETADRSSDNSRR